MNGYRYGTLSGIVLATLVMLVSALCGLVAGGVVILIGVSLMVLADAIRYAPPDPWDDVKHPGPTRTYICGTHGPVEVPHGTPDSKAAIIYAAYLDGHDLDRAYEDIEAGVISSGNRQGGDDRI